MARMYAAVAAQDAHSQPSACHGSVFIQMRTASQQSELITIGADS